MTEDIYAGENAVFMHCLPAFHDLNTGIGRKISEKYDLHCFSDILALLRNSEDYVSQICCPDT